MSNDPWLLLPWFPFTASFFRPQEELPSITDFMKPEGRPRVIAHRGFSGRCPENTLAAFRKAIEVCADMVELDVLLSADGRVVVIHDETLDRTTNGEGDVAVYTLDELKNLDAGSWFSAEFEGESIPTLEEVLALTKNRILVNIEIKQGAVTESAHRGIVEKVVGLVAKYAVEDQTVISSFDPRALGQVRALDPTLMTASLYNERLHKGAGPMQIMESVSSKGLNLSKKQVAPEIINACHDNGRLVAVYTLNDEKTMRKLLDLGVDALFTNFPDRMSALLGGNRDSR